MKKPFRYSSFAELCEIYKNADKKDYTQFSKSNVVTKEQKAQIIKIYNKKLSAIWKNLKNEIVL